MESRLGNAVPRLLTPTRRLAHRLRVAHDSAAEAAGLAVWTTLEALPWQSWLVTEFLQARRAGRAGGQLLAQQAAELLWRRIVEDDPGESGVVSPAGLAAAAHRAWCRMHDWQIPDAALAEDPTAETRAFVRWMRRYEHWLAEHDAVDPHCLAERIDATTVQGPLRLVGFDELTPAQAGLLARMRAGGVAVEVDGLPRRLGALSRVEARVAREEIEAAACWAAAWLERDPSARLAIVATDLGSRRDPVRRQLERVLLPAAGYSGGPAPESRGFAIAESPPLAGRPVVVAALDLLAMFLTGSDLAACGRLLRSHHVQGAAAEDGPRAMLDAWIRRNTAQDSGLARLRPLAAARRCPVLAGLIERGLGVAQQVRRGRPSAWSGHFHDLLAAVGWPGEGLPSHEYQVAERLRALLAELATADEIAGMLGTGDALELLRDFAQRVPYEPQDIDAPLLVIEPEAAIGMDFDGLWLLGLEASRWPPPAAPDPFLPRDWQVRRGMPGADARLAERQSRRLFDRLVQSADEAVVSVAQFNGETPVLASALIDATPRRDGPSPWPHPRLIALIHAARPSLERLADAYWPRPAPGQPARGGARLLELQSACPFRAGAEFRLHARALEEPETGLGADDRGVLVHGALARVWRALGDQPGLLARDATSVRRLVRASIDAEVTNLQRDATRLTQRLLELETDWLEQRIAELLDCDRARAQFAVGAIETRGMAVLGDLALEVQLDRVDRLADGRLAVIDYKSGGDAETGAWLGDRPRLPQVPLYAQTVGADRVAAVAFGRVRAGETRYAGLARDPDIFGGIASFGGQRQPKGFASWEALLTHWRERLRALADEYLAGDARLAPHPGTACRYCHLAALCRIEDSALGADRVVDADA